MIDTIEKVARALRDYRTQLRADNDAARAERGLWPDRHLHPTDEQYAQAAIAAVFDALETPSEAAVTEGRAAWLESASDYTVLRTSLRAAHIAMLAKAREEMCDENHV